MLRKLDREISRACSAVAREEIADHCTNAAWTAWHLTEWVWADIKQDYALKTALANEAGVSPQRFDCDAFRRFVQSEAQCPALAYLEVIAVSSKHVGADPNDGLEFVIEASAPGAAVISGTGLDWQPIYDYDDRPRFVFKIVEGEDQSKAIPWLNKARDHWAQFINDHNIARD